MHKYLYINRVGKKKNPKSRATNKTARTEDVTKRMKSRLLPYDYFSNKQTKKAYFPGIHPPQGVRGESTLGMPFEAVERLGFSKFSNMMSDASTHLGYI